MATALKVTKATATSPENLARINGMVEALGQYVMNLACRWADEKEYEDIADYGKALAAKLPEGFTLVSMSKKPFGFTFSIGTDARYQMTAKMSGEVAWTRIG